MKDGKMEPLMFFRWWLYAGALISQTYTLLKVVHSHASKDWQNFHLFLTSQTT
jgi:hypothetical protein